MNETPEELLEYMCDYVVIASITLGSRITDEEIRFLRHRIKKCIFDAENKRRMGIKKLGDDI